MKYKAKSILVLFAVGLLLGGVWFLIGSSYGPEQARAAVEDHHDHDEHDGDELPGHDGVEEHEDAVHAEHGHDEHGHAEHVDIVDLESREMQEFGIELATAGSGTLELHVELPGEIVINADRMAHVVPRVPGIVRDVRKKLGDPVEDKELMAVLESRELADAKAEYLAAAERFELAGLNFEREERLWKKKVSAEQEYLDARQALTETRIALRSAEQKLHTLGLSDKYLKNLPGQPDVTFTRYEIRAPFDGVVIQKHITLGEALGNESEAFVVADLSSVWIDISVYQKDLATVRQGQMVRIVVGHGIPAAEGRIAYIGPLVGEATRTALARVILPNPDGFYRPGMFVTAQVQTASLKVPLVVPKTALQTFEDETVVFVRSPEGFKPQPVKIGRSNTTRVEIVSGLNPGQTYVSEGAFTLKAQLSKGAFGDGHNH